MNKLKNLSKFDQKIFLENNKKFITINFFFKEIL
jgi:hypothetical protein